MRESAVSIERMAIGGEGVGHLADGRVVFVAGVATGDVVDVEVIDDRDRWARAIPTDILTPSEHRTTPSCPAVAPGCGGCDWQHVSETDRAQLQTAMVAEVLQRTAGVDIEPLHVGGVPTRGYRSTVRMAVDEAGRAGFRRHRSHEVVSQGGCEVAVDALQPVIAADWSGASEVVGRVGVATGDALVVVGPSLSQLDGDGRGTELSDGVRIIGRDELDAGRRAWIFDEVAGRRWRISADSFFQSGPAAVALLTDRAAVHLGDVVMADTPCADLYAGVGIFAGTLGARLGGAWTLVEGSPAATADARVNLTDIDARIVRSSVERWRAGRHEVVIADPPRAGMGRKGVAALSASGASAAVLVSCDLGSLGKDLARLRADGWEPRAVDVLDLFPGTAHVEVMTSLRRAAR